MKALTIEELGWRARSGILGKHASNAQLVHALIGYFLRDRTSPTPFPGRDMLVDNSCFDWGIAPPLEKVIEGGAELNLLLGLPELYRQGVSIIEPWPHVGINLAGQTVRASKNVAYLLQQIADADSILFPVWQSGVSNPARLANLLSAGIATIVQGGDPSVHDPASFNGTRASLEDILGLVEQLLMRRSSGSGPCIFICLGHQLAAAAHVRLIRRAVAEVLDLKYLSLDAHGHALASLQRVCRRIAEVGETLEVRKNGQVVARGWHDTRFAVARNEATEVGTRRLLPYKRRGDGSHVPGELHDIHALIADEHEGVIDTLIGLERELQVEMFHSDEVNEEAALFACWAYKLLHETIVAIRYEVAVSPVAWLLSLPYAVEIMSQTEVAEGVWTEVCTTAIYYKDWETHSIRRSFTCQFHPELMADISDIGNRAGPRYHELKNNDGVRLLARLMYHGMQE